MGGEVWGGVRGGDSREPRLPEAAASAWSPCCPSPSVRSVAATSQEAAWQMTSQRPQLITCCPRGRSPPVRGWLSVSLGPCQNDHESSQEEGKGWEEMNADASLCSGPEKIQSVSRRPGARLRTGRKWRRKRQEGGRGEGEKGEKEGKGWRRWGRRRGKEEEGE